MKLLAVCVVTAILLFSLFSEARADITPGERPVSIERGRLTADEQTRNMKGTEKASEAKQDFTLDYGGWVFFDMEKYDDVDHSRAIEDWVKNDTGGMRCHRHR